MPSFELADYTYACNGYCSSRWGPPSYEVIPATCPRCKKRQEASAVKAELRYQNELATTYRKWGKAEAAKRRERKAKKLAEAAAEKGHLRILADPSSE